MTNVQEILFSLKMHGNDHICRSQASMAPLAGPPVAKYSYVDPLSFRCSPENKVSGQSRELVLQDFEVNPFVLKTFFFFHLAPSLIHFRWNMKSSVTGSTQFSNRIQDY